MSLPLPLKMEHSSKLFQPSQIWQGSRVTSSSGMPLRAAYPWSPSLLHHERRVHRAIQAGLAESFVVRKRERNLCLSHVPSHSFQPWSHGAFLPAFRGMCLRNPILSSSKRLLLQMLSEVTEELEITAEKGSLGSSDIIPNPFCLVEWY